MTAFSPHALKLALKHALKLALKIEYPPPISIGGFLPQVKRLLQKPRFHLNSRRDLRTTETIPYQTALDGIHLSTGTKKPHTRWGYRLFFNVLV
jgi:hypothetical protein